MGSARRAALSRSRHQIGVARRRGRAAVSRRRGPVRGRRRSRLCRSRSRRRRTGARFFAGSRNGCAWLSGIVRSHGHRGARRVPARTARAHGGSGSGDTSGPRGGGRDDLGRRGRRRTVATETGADVSDADPVRSTGGTMTDAGTGRGPQAREDEAVRETSRTEGAILK